MAKRQLKNKPVKAGWTSVPLMDWQQWLAQYIMAGLVLKYHTAHGKLPKKINVAGVTVKELKSGEGLISAELE